MIRQKGTRKGDLLQFNIPRKESITENNLIIPPSMGGALPINFQVIGNNNAVTIGDFVLLANEVILHGEIMTVIGQ
ncbi:DUF1259 domain-containing protein [Cohnella sp. CFH 77786]|uniref:DUF1259 domain-containing protein n=1 Tax=Cohnella sp. CFH 77786 TaxID=2662265 RepID=UPI001C60A1C1|nr:DUF1259 domain-containing protein [Cohnella sp. CFH 77786]